MTNARFDDTLRLAGDEDGGVGLNCMLCDRGGAPIAYHTYAGDRTYEGTDVQVVHTIAALINRGEQHLTEHHPV